MWEMIRFVVEIIGWVVVIPLLVWAGCTGVVLWLDWVERKLWP